MSIFGRTVHGDLRDDTQIIPQGTLFSSFKHVAIDPAAPAGTVTVNGADLSPGEAFSYPFIGKGHASITLEASGNANLKFFYIL